MSINQNEVLDWIKQQFATKSNYPLDALQLRSGLGDLNMPVTVNDAYNQLSEAEEFEVILEFAKWGLSQE